ncbi:uncharacterized protein LOC124454246 isoform X2 [Xenia sp. Carnegie-2017]|nr:uncharacterized protein LOC124454246 isoform X2 [Xenia sp. Carnegie-2017]
MESKKRFCIITVLLFSTVEFLMMNEACEFERAIAEIESQNGSINYDTFCSEKPSGEEKLACRIQNVPSVGFLVCKKPVYNGSLCRETIETELENLETIQTTYDLKTVQYFHTIIDNVTCASEQVNAANCSGFLECWIDISMGMFKHIRDHIITGKQYETIKKINDLVKDVKIYTETQNGLEKTIADLSKLLDFMAPKTSKILRQVCDLQGFFMKKGGFQIADASGILEKTVSDICWEDEPTTDEVLFALNETIIKLGQK